MRVAVTGSNGQAAQALAEQAPAAGVVLLRLGRPGLDLANPRTIAPALEAAQPDVIVNAAAYTDVDRAESEPDLAGLVNGRGAGAVTAAARALGVPLIQISTDYVFDGAATRAYREDDAVGPLCVYGASKLAGEREVAAAQPDHVILRTAWVYGPVGRNFVRTMLRLGEARREVAVVADQHGCPTAAGDLAAAILTIARRLHEQPHEAALRGVFHAAGAGETHWAEFAQAIFTEAERHGRAGVQVRPIPASDYPTAARRPMNSRLDCTKLARCYDIVLPPWRVSLAACVARILRETDRSAT